MPEATTETTASESTTTQTEATGSGTAEGQQLGDGGKKALDEERSARRAADKALKDAQSELDKLRAEQKKRDDAELSETDRLRKQVAEVEAQREKLLGDQRQERTRFTVEREATRLKFADPADAWGLIDQSRLDFDANGNATNAKTLLEELAKAKPYLTARPGAGSFEGGARGDGTAGASTHQMDDWLRKAAGKQ